MSLPSVGWVGLGDQGAPIARAIAEAGYPLHAWARRPSSLAALDGVPYTAWPRSPRSARPATSSACASTRTRTTAR